MPKVVVLLTHNKISKIKADSENIQKITDRKGLFLMIAKNVEKLWRFVYARPCTKKRNSISFGSYP